MGGAVPTPPPPPPPPVCRAVDQGQDQEKQSGPSPWSRRRTNLRHLLDSYAIPAPVLETNMLLLLRAGPGNWQLYRPIWDDGNSYYQVSVSNKLIDLLREAAKESYFLVGRPLRPTPKII